MKPQWEKRVDVTVLIYQFLLLEKTKDEVVQEAFEQYEFDAWQLQILEHSCDELANIIKKVSPLLDKTWTWERMNYMDRAIIVEAIAEFDCHKTPKKVIIDQALITARKYNVDDKYKYINAILDKVIVE